MKVKIIDSGEFPDEIWKPIKYNEIYKISNYGRIKKGNKIYKITNKTGWYLTFRIKVGDSLKTVRPHRLVAEHFIPNTENKPQVNHKDLNKQNNYVGNLEWVTRSENICHSQKLNPAQLNGIINYNKNRRIIILQYDLRGNFIAEHKGCIEASERTGVCARNINQVAKQEEYKKGMTRKQAGGFIWRIADVN